MTLVDAGPLIALANPDDPDHLECVRAAETVSVPLVTSWPSFTEAMHLVCRVLGWLGKSALLQLILEQKLLVWSIEDGDLPRLADVMEQYRDRPMDLADATLLILAENHGFDRIFSLDSDFYIYRMANGRTLEVIP